MSQEERVVRALLVERGLETRALAEARKLAPSLPKQHRPFGLVEHEPLAVEPPVLRREFGEIASQLSKLRRRPSVHFPGTCRCDEELGLHGPELTQRPAVLQGRCFSGCCTQIREQALRCALAGFGGCAEAPEELADCAHIERQGVLARRFGEKAFFARGTSQNPPVR
jgi:hypothetical protein